MQTKGFKPDQFRSQTASLMACRECRGPMLLGDTGLVCAAGCGRIMPLWHLSRDQLQLAWPDRVVKHAARPGPSTPSKTLLLPIMEK